jgi:hypothetical protein
MFRKVHGVIFFSFANMGTYIIMQLFDLLMDIFLTIAFIYKTDIFETAVNVTESKTEHTTIPIDLYYIADF